MCSYRCLVRTLSLDANPAVARRQAGLGGTDTQRRLRVRPGSGMLENNCRVRQPWCGQPTRCLILDLQWLLFDGRLLRRRRADDTLDDKNGKAVGCWLLVAGCWWFSQLAAGRCGRQSYYRTNQLHKSTTPGLRGAKESARSTESGCIVNLWTKT